MRGAYGSILAVHLAVAAFHADPPAAGFPAIAPSPGGKKTDRVFIDGVKLASNEFEMLTLTGYAGAVTWDLTVSEGVRPVKWFGLKPEESVIGVRTGSTEPDRHDSPKGPTIAVFRLADGKATVAAWGVKDGSAFKLATFTIDTNTGPRPPPEPKPPEPKPPEPKPPVVTSFRVIFATESGDTLTAGQRAAMDAKSVRDYLTAKTTPEGKWVGWRQFDKDATADNEQPAMKALWTAVKPKLTAMPCVVIEVNGKADILPLPTSAADSLTLLKSYGGN